MILERTKGDAKRDANLYLGFLRQQRSQFVRCSAGRVPSVGVSFGHMRLTCAIGCAAPARLCNSRLYEKST